MYKITCENFNNELIIKAFKNAIEELEGVVVKEITNDYFMFYTYEDDCTVVSRFTVLVNKLYAKYVSNLEVKLIERKEFYNSTEFNVKYHKHIWNIIVGCVEIVDDMQITNDIQIINNI